MQLLDFSAYLFKGTVTTQGNHSGQPQGIAPTYEYFRNEV